MDSSIRHGKVQSLITITSFRLSITNTTGHLVVIIAYHLISLKTGPTNVIARHSYSS